MPAAHRQARQCASLGNVGRAVEDRRHDAIEVVNHGAAIGVEQRLRNHRPACTYTCKACIFAKGARLNGTLLGTCGVDETIDK